MRPFFYMSRLNIRRSYKGTGIMVYYVRESILFKFFARIFLILIIVVLLAFAAIYYYVERQNGEYISSLIERSQKQFANTLSLYPDASESIKESFKKSHKKVVENNVVKIELKDKKQNILINYEMQPVPAHVRSVYQTISFAPGKLLNYIMLPINEQSFALVYIKKIYTKNQQFYTLKMIILLPSDTVNMMREKMKEVFYAIVLIISLVMISIFPLIYRQYHELENDRKILLKSNFQMIEALGNAIALRDSDTSDHNYRVTYYALQFAKSLSLDKDLFPSLLKGAFLHDLGKIGISDTILLKPGKLNSTEYIAMQKHVEYGLNIIETIAWIKDDAASIIASHHEHFDGTGYPKGLKGNDIPYIARIFAIVDVFDALTSKRPYKDPLDLEESLKILKQGSGTHFDPQMIEIFVAIAPKLYEDVHWRDNESLQMLLKQVVSPYIYYFKHHLT